jgi:hypothetical protein
LKDAQIQFCLIGGLAVGILAKPRATEDIDLLVLLTEDDMEHLSKILKKHFQLIQDHNVMHFKNATIWRVIIENDSTEKKSLVIVDLIFADNEIYKNAVMNSITLTLDDVSIPVVRIEHLIEIKKLANRPSDQIDIQSLENVFNQL